MTVDELAPYLGIPCFIRLRCRGCGGAHVLTGTPRLGKHLNEFVLKGYTFSVEDIEQIWRHPSPPRRRSVRDLLLLPWRPFKSGNA